jgi:hypothetical protein
MREFHERDASDGADTGTDGRSDVAAEQGGTPLQSVPNLPT